MFHSCFLVLRVIPWGVLPLDFAQKRFSGFYGFKRFKKGVERRIIIRSAAEYKWGEPESLLDSGFPIFVYP